MALRKQIDPRVFAGATNSWDMGNPSYDFEENPTGPDLGQPSMPTSPMASNAFSPPRSQPDVVNDVYAPQLRDVQSRLSDAFNPPQLGVGGTLRHIAGAMLSRRNPQLGAIVSGDFGRQRQIAGLTNQQKLIEDAINQNRAMNMADLNAQNVKSEITERGRTNDIRQQVADTKETPPVKGIDEQTFQYLTTQGGMKPDEALERIRNTKETENKGGQLTDLDIGGENHKVLVDTKTGHVIRDLGKSKLPVPPAAPGDKAFETENAKQVTKDLTMARGADFRLRSMQGSYKDAVEKNDQQAMLNLLTNHIGMTLGLQKGARITKDILHEATASAPWLQAVAAKFDSDGYLSGVTLTKPQMDSMMKLAHAQRHTAWQQAHDSASQAGLTDKVQFPKDFTPQSDTPTATGGIKIIRDANGRITGVQ